MSRRLLFVLILLAHACRVDEHGNIPCYDDYTCPPAYPVCSGAGAGTPGSCVASDGTHLPSIAAVAVVGAEGRTAGAPVRGKVRVDVVANARAGLKSLTLAAGSMTFAEVAAEPPLHVFEVDTAALPDGAVELTATLTPGDGSAATTSKAFSLDVDNTAPTLTLVSLAPRQARAGDVVTIDLLASEDLGELSASMTANGASAGDFSRAAPLPGAHAYRLIRAVTADLAAGNYTVTVAAQDLAGNANLDALGAQTFTVRQAFQLTALTLSPPAGRLASPIHAVLTLPAGVEGAAPVFTLTDAAQHARVFAAAAVHAAGSWTVSDTVLAGDAPGLAQVTAVVTDPSGNKAALSANYLIDETPPVLSGLTAAQPIVDAQGAPQLLAGFASEPLATASVTTDSGDAGACTFDNALSPVPVRCTIAVGAPGAVTATVALTDQVGNGSSASVRYAVIAPAATSLTAAATTITAGGSTTLTPIFGAGQTAVIMPGNLPATSGVPLTVSPASTTTYTLTVTNEGGAQTTGTAQVTVIAAPAIVSFGASAVTVPAGGSFTLSFSSTGGAGQITSPGLGRPLAASGTGQAAVAAPTAAAPVTYLLTVTNAAGTAVSQAITIQVTPLPAAALTFAGGATALTVAAHADVTLEPVFTGGAGSLDGAAVASGAAITISNLVASTTFTLTVTSAGGAVATASVTATVQAAIDSFTASQLYFKQGTSPQIALTAQFEGSGASGDAPATVNGTLAISSGVPLTVTPTQTTTYTLAVTGTGANNTATRALTVTALPAPAAALAEDAATITLGQSVTLTPVFDGAGVLTNDRDSSALSATSGAALTLSPASSTVYTLTAKNLAGDTATASQTVLVVAAPSIASFSATPPIISAGGASALAATFAGGTASLDHGAALGPVSPAATTTYTLTVTNAATAPASVSAQATVTVVPLPSITSFTAPGNLTAIILTSGGSTTLTPSFASGAGAISNDANATVTPASNGVGFSTGALTSSRTYALTVTNAAGASTTATVLVEVVPAPVCTSLIPAAQTITTGIEDAKLVPTFSNGAGVLTNDRNGTALAVASGTQLDAGTQALSTTYTLTVTNAATTPQSCTTTLQVFVAAPPSIVSGTFHTDLANNAMTVGDTGAITFTAPTYAGGNAFFSAVLGGAPNAGGSASIGNGGVNGTFLAKDSLTTAGAYPYTITASNAATNAATLQSTTTINVFNAPSVASGTLSVAPATYTTGDPGTLTFTAPAFSASVVSAYLGTTATATSGVAINSSGVVSIAKPGLAAGQSQQYWLFVVNGAGKAVQSQSVTVNAIAAPSATGNLTVAPATITAGEPGSVTLTAPAFTASSATVSDGTSTAAIASGGTALLPKPAGAAGSSQTYTLTLNNSVGTQTNTSRTASVAIVAPPAISSGTFHTDLAGNAMTVGDSGTITFTAPAYASANGAFSTAVLGGSPNNGGSGLIASGGTNAVFLSKSTLTTAGAYPYTITASNSATTPATLQGTVTINVFAPPAVSAGQLSVSPATIASGDVTTNGLVFTAPAFSATSAFLSTLSSGATSGTAIVSGGTVQMNRPGATTTYYLYLVNAAGKIVQAQQATVTAVGTPSFSGTFSLSQTHLTLNDTLTAITFSLPTFNNISSATITGGGVTISTGVTSGATVPLPTNPGQTTRYTLTGLNGAGGTATASVVMMVGESTGAAAMPLPRVGGALAALPGKLFVAGGAYDIGSTVVNTGTVYDATTQGFISPEATMAASAAPNGRFRPTAVLLTGGANSGKVLVSGGKSDAMKHELFDPASGSFAASTAILTARCNHAAVEVVPGKVLIAGGDDCGAPANPVSTVEIWDGVSADVLVTHTLSTARIGLTATLLSNGKVLLAGGGTATADLMTYNAVTPATSTFALVNFSGGGAATPRKDHTATVLNDGRVLLAGGKSDQTTLTAELYNPISNSFAPTANEMSAGMARIQHSAVKLSSGLVLIIGGKIFGGSALGLNTTEFFDPINNTFSAGPSLLRPRFLLFAGSSGPGLVLVGGGIGDVTQSPSPAETLILP